MKINIKNSLALIVLMLSTSALFSQNITITGIVTDSLKNPLDLANVVAINSETQGLDGFGITAPDGRYKIKVKENSTYSLKISYLGFQTKELSITTAAEDIKRDIVLLPESESLDEVEVVYEIPVTIKGDTIVYNTDSFVSGTEKKLADVLSKLPGVEVNDDGEIEVEGKTVTKVMVEGKDFFDGDSKLASKNIPANALSKVEVLRNYSEVDQLKGVTNNQDNVAINIRLKEGKKKFWFGEITGGIGLDDRFLANPRLFYYSPKFSLNVLTDLNNIGELPFTNRDFRAFSGGFRNVNRDAGTVFTTGSGGLGLSNLQNNRAKDIDTKFGAVNFSYAPSSSLDLTGFAIYSYSNTLLETVASRTFITSGQEEQTNTNIDQVTKLGLLKFSSKYKPSDTFQWDYDILLKLSDESEQVDVLSVSDQTDNIAEDQVQKPTTINQNTNVYYTVNEKNILSFEGQYTYEDEDPFYNASREVLPFQGTIPFIAQPSGFDINQDRFVTTNRVDAKLDYYLITGKKSNLNFTLGTTQSFQNFDSNIFQILENGNSLDFSQDTFSNQGVEFNFSDLYLGFHYKLVAGKFTINPGFTAHTYKATNTQLGTEVSDELTNVVPDLFVNLQLKSSESLRFNYRVSREFSDINNFAEGYVFNSYNSLYQGNRNLESALYHSVSMNFFSFNMFNLQNIFANVSYNKRIDAFKTSGDINVIDQVNSTINSNLADETFNAAGNFQRTYGKIKVSSRASFAYSNTNNIINSEQRNSKSFTQNYRASLASSFKNAPNLELGYTYIVNDYNNGGTESTFFTSRPFVEFDAAFLKNFIFLADYQYNGYRDSANTVNNNFDFLNASLSYQKKDSKWEYTLQGTNLLNTQQLNQDNFSDLFSRTSAYTVQPRYVLLKVKYDL